MQPTDNEGIIAIAEALKVNSSLKSLYFEGGVIRYEAAFAIAEALQVNSTLISLELISTADDIAALQSLGFSGS